MKSKEEIEQLAANLANPNVCKTTNWIEGYTQCQEDMALQNELLLDFLSLSKNSYKMVNNATNEKQVLMILQTRASELFDKLQKLNNQD